MAARHCMVRDSSDPAGFVSASRCSTLGTCRTVALVGYARTPMEIPATRAANATAAEGTIHFFGDDVLSTAKMTPPTIAPSTSPITVLLFSAYTSARRFTPPADR